MRFLFAAILLLGGSAFAADLKVMGELLQKHRRSVVVVKDPKAAGSAFIAQIGKGKYLITNQHVVAGLATPTFSMPDRAVLKVGTAAAAVGHDIISFGIGDDVTAIEAMQGVDQFAVVGDDVVVLGNPDGAGVIRPITGKIVGIGPQLVEVSAEFVAGNSGSPIIHVPTGKVIAVATYLTRERADIDRGRLVPTVRRFGYRLDSIKRWEPVRWWHFNDDHETVEKVHARSVELMTVLLAGDTSAFSQITDPMIERPLTKFRQSIANVRTQKEFADEATNLMNSLVRAANEDIAHARQRVQYDYFQERLAEEEKLRAPISDLLEKMIRQKPRL